MTMRLPTRLQTTFSSFSYRNYRLWFFGQVLSLMGTWMQSTAQGFLIYELTRSPAFLGYVGFANGIPTWLFMLYGGVIADRIPRRTMILVTQVGMMLLAFILAALTFRAVVQPWHILLLAFGLGIANAFEAPARLAFVVELVEMEDLTNAIALNSGMFNTASAIGPAIAGLVYATLGPGWCFALNGVSFLAVIIALLFMRISPAPPKVQHGSALAEVRDGLRYAFSHTTIRTILMVIATMSLLGVSFGALLPAWAVDVLGGDVKTNGWLRSLQGVGALGSALLIASLGRFRSRGRLLSLGLIIFPIFLLAFAQVRWLPLSLLLILGIGASSILVMNLSNSLVQGEVPNEKRGRVMSIYSFLFFGIMPLGSLLAGVIAELTSEQLTVTIFGLTLLVFSWFVWLKSPQLRKLE